MALPPRVAMAAGPGDAATPRWPDPWAFLAQLPVSRELGLNRTMWLLLTVAVVLIGVVMAALVDPWRVNTGRGAGPDGPE